MPRKTPVRELQKEEPVVGSPLRRSSRISASSPVPTKVITRRNSASEASSFTPVATRGRRQSLSQDSENDNKTEVKKNTSTIRTRRNSGVQNKEEEVEETPTKPRTRRSSISKESKELATDVKKTTRRRKSVSEESAAEESSTVKSTRTRASSVTKKTEIEEPKVVITKPATPLKKSPSSEVINGSLDSINESQDEEITSAETSKVLRKKVTEVHKVELDLSVINEASFTEEEKTPLKDSSIKDASITQLQKISPEKKSQKIEEHVKIVTNEKFDSSISDTSFNLQLSSSLLENSKSSVEGSDATNKENVNPKQNIEQNDCEPMEVDEMPSPIKINTPVVTEALTQKLNNSLQKISEEIDQFLGESLPEKTDLTEKKNGVKEVSNSPKVNKNITIDVLATKVLPVKGNSEHASDSNLSKNNDVQLETIETKYSNEATKKEEKEILVNSVDETGENRMDNTTSVSELPKVVNVSVKLSDSEAVSEENNVADTESLVHCDSEEANKLNTESTKDISLQLETNETVSEDKINTTSNVGTVVIAEEVVQDSIAIEELPKENDTMDVSESNVEKRVISEVSETVLENPQTFEVHLNLTDSVDTNETFSENDKMEQISDVVKNNDGDILKEETLSNTSEEVPKAIHINEKVSDSEKTSPTDNVKKSTKQSESELEDDLIIELDSSTNDIPKQTHLSVIELDDSKTEVSDLVTTEKAETPSDTEKTDDCDRTTETFSNMTKQNGDISIQEIVEIETEYGVEKDRSISIIEIKDSIQNIDSDNELDNGDQEEQNLIESCSPETEDQKQNTENSTSNVPNSNQDNSVKSNIVDNDMDLKYPIPSKKQSPQVSSQSGIETEIDDNVFEETNKTNSVVDSVEVGIPITTKRRSNDKTAITLQETIKVGENAEEVVSGRIHKVVDLFCASLNNTADVSINVSLDFIGPGSDEDNKADLNVSLTVKERKEQSVGVQKGSKRRKICRYSTDMKMLQNEQSDAESEAELTNSSFQSLTSQLESSGTSSPVIKKETPKNLSRESNKIRKKLEKSVDEEESNEDIETESSDNEDDEEDQSVASELHDSKGYRSLFNATFEETENDETWRSSVEDTLESSEFSDSDEIDEDVLSQEEIHFNDVKKTRSKSSVSSDPDVFLEPVEEVDTKNNDSKKRKLFRLSRYNVGQNLTLNETDDESAKEEVKSKKMKIFKSEEVKVNNKMLKCNFSETTTSEGMAPEKSEIKDTQRKNKKRRFITTDVEEHPVKIKSKPDKGTKFRDIKPSAGRKKHCKTLSMMPSRRTSTGWEITDIVDML